MDIKTVYYIFDAERFTDLYTTGIIATRENPIFAYYNKKIGLSIFASDNQNIKTVCVVPLLIDQSIFYRKKITCIENDKNGNQFEYDAHYLFIDDYVCHFPDKRFMEVYKIGDC